MLQLVARTTFQLFQLIENPAVCFPTSRNKQGIFRIHNVSINTSQISWMHDVCCHFNPSHSSIARICKLWSNFQVPMDGFLHKKKTTRSFKKTNSESQRHRNPWIWGLLCHFRKRQNNLIFGCLRTSKNLADSMFPAFISLDVFPKISLMVQAAYHFHWSRDTTCHWSLPSHLKTMRCIWSTIASLHAN